MLPIPLLSHVNYNETVDQQSPIQPVIDYLTASGDPKEKLPARWKRGVAIGTTSTAAIAAICVAGQGLVPNTLASLQGKFIKAELKNYDRIPQYSVLAAGILLGYGFDIAALSRPALEISTLVVTTLFLETLIKVSAIDVKKLMNPGKLSKAEKIKVLENPIDTLQQASLANRYDEENRLLLQHAAELGSLIEHPTTTTDTVADFLFEKAGKRPSIAARSAALTIAQGASVMSILLFKQGIVSNASSLFLGRLIKAEIKDDSFKKQVAIMSAYFTISVLFDTFVLNKSFTDPANWVAGALAMSTSITFLASRSQKVMNPVKTSAVLPQHILDNNQPSFCCRLFQRTATGKPPLIARTAALAATTIASIASVQVAGQGLVSKTCSTFYGRLHKSETKEWDKKYLYAALFANITATLLFDVFILNRQWNDLSKFVAASLAIDLFIKIASRHLEQMLNPTSVDEDDEDDDVAEPTPKKQDPDIEVLATQLQESLVIDCQVDKVAESLSLLTLTPQNK